MQYENPEFFWLLLFIPIYWFLYFRGRRKSKQVIGMPSVKVFDFKGSILPLFVFILPFLRSIMFALLVVAIARPRVSLNDFDQDNQRGIDIIICADVSLSMMAKDLKPNRLEAVKEIGAQFIQERKQDRIGVVEYAMESMMKCPLTTDKKAQLEAIKSLDPYELEPGTDIGTGLLTSINHIKDSKAKSKVIILMSDGQNTSGSDSETLMAAKIAKSKDIKIYTIGIGKGDVFTDILGGGFQGRVLTGFNEEMMKEVAKLSNGKYYNATNNDRLKQIYSNINELEKSDINKKKYHLGYREYYFKYLIWALVILMIELFLRTTIFKSI